MELIKGVPKERIEEVITWSFPYFKDIISEYFYRLILEHETDWDISVLLLNDKNEIKGIYLLGNNQLKNIVNNEKYNNLTGVEGVVLVISDEIRGQGWGNKLKDYPKTLDVDYIWGQQLKKLNNLEDWLKRRELVYESEFVYITAEIFKK